MKKYSNIQHGLFLASRGDGVKDRYSALIQANTDPATRLKTSALTWMQANSTPCNLEETNTKIKTKLSSTSKPG